MLGVADERLDPSSTLGATRGDLVPALAVAPGRAVRVPAGDADPGADAGHLERGVHPEATLARCLVGRALPHQIVGLFLNSGIAENQEPLALAASFLVIAGLF